MKKNRNRLLAAGLICLLGLALSIPAMAGPIRAEGELRLISYNIAGLPIPSIFNADRRSPWKNGAEIGRQVGAAGYDLVAVQEDFSNYSRFKKALDYPYFSYHKGNIPAGDGLDFFSKRPIYNFTRVTWAQRYGGFTYGGTDEYTPKGFSHAVMELAPGVYLDIYDLHANASGSEERGLTVRPSAVARRAQFEQLSAYIQAHSQGRALVILGDFNARLRQPADGMYEVLLAPNGIRDTWAETFNGGKEQFDDGAWPTGDQGERVDRILYRGGEALELTLVESAGVRWKDAEGRNLSDHEFSWTAALRYVYNGEPETRDDLRAPEPIPFFTKAWDYITNFFRDLGLLVKEIPAMLGLKK